MKIKNKEIAERLGISVTAVSLAINGRPGVSEETRQKVLQLVNESLNADTISAAPQRASAAPEGHGTILLNVHKNHGQVINDKPFFTNLVECIQQEAMQRHYMLTLTHFMPGQNLEEYVNYLKTLKIDGMIIMATEMLAEDLEYYKKLDVPMVVMDSSYELGDVDTVELDNQVAEFRAFDYAYRMGHRDIGFLKGDPYIANFGHHFDGFMDAVRRYHTEENNHPVITLPCNIEGAYNEMKKFLANPPKDFKMPTLFMADLDYLAIGAMQACKEFGYTIPDDISFIGYDDVTACEIFSPQLTTTRVNRNDIGRLTMDRLAQVMENPHAGYYTTTQVSSKLIIRDSVKDLNKK